MSGLAQLGWRPHNSRRALAGSGVSGLLLWGLPPADGNPDTSFLAKIPADHSLGVWEVRLKAPMSTLTAGKLTIQVADYDRNVARIERAFSVR